MVTIDEAKNAVNELECMSIDDGEGGRYAGGFLVVLACFIKQVEAKETIKLASLLRK